MGLSFSLFFAELLQMEDWKLRLIEEDIASRSPYHRGGRRTTHKRKSHQGRPTRRRLYTSH
jgi:hypothetical protein